MGALERASAAAGVSTPSLMERAGAALAQEAMRLAGPGGRVLVLCGRGNNGGDGLVAARWLRAMGLPVSCELLPGEVARMPSEARGALEAAGFSPAPIAESLAVERGDVVIDALFGTGLSRAPAGDAASAIHRIARWRALGAKVLAADLPSGLRSDTGQPFAPCVKADVTVTFGEMKVGLALEPGASLAGEVKVADIGIPEEAMRQASPPWAHLLEEADAVSRIPIREADSHKGTYGHVLVVAGSAGKTGAAALSGMGALRAGAGLSTVAARPDALPVIQAHAPELMGFPLAGGFALELADLEALLEAAQGKQALAIGPGIPRGPETGALLGALAERLEIPMVLDADALNAIAADKSLLARAKAPLVATPHPGEMGRLLGATPAEVLGDRIGAARAVAAERRMVVVLKGAHTVVAGVDGTAYVNPTGNPGMATGGAGDVLTGICAGLLAQGLSPLDAALVAVYAHGLAGDLAARRRGQLGLVASDLLDGICEVWAGWGR